jgi:hypothetical protein
MMRQIEWLVPAHRRVPGRLWLQADQCHKSRYFGCPRSDYALGPLHQNFLTSWHHVTFIVRGANPE